MATKVKSPKAERSDYLIGKAAEALEQGAIPFSGPWLVEHEVTSDECGHLSDRLAVILRGFLESRPEDQGHLVALGAVAELDPKMREIMRTTLEVNRARKRLDRVCDSVDRKGGR